MKTLSDFPNLGFGLGLRSSHFDDIIDNPKQVDWFEALSENYMGLPGMGFGTPLLKLEKIRSSYPVVLHGVSLSIGGSDPLDWKYLQRYKELIDRIEPKWISDHLCWTGVDGVNLHDLLPLPYSKAVIDHVVERISAVQEFLGRRLLIENVSSYVEFKHSEMMEWEFISEIVNRADCGLLLDVNNIYVSSVNHGFDPVTYLENIPQHRVGQMHLAGHTNSGDFLIDTHDEMVCEPVWDLYKKAWEIVGPTSVMIERDDKIPPFMDLVKELNQARDVVFNKRQLKSESSGFAHTPAMV